jgi:hypothetical protein
MPNSVRAITTTCFEADARRDMDAVVAFSRWFSRTQVALHPGG